MRVQFPSSASSPCGLSRLGGRLLSGITRVQFLPGTSRSPVGKKSETYTQCSLAKGGSVDVVWIPTKFANKGKFIKLKQADNTWDDGWLVAETYTTRDAQYLIEHERDYKNTRKASDI